MAGSSNPKVEILREVRITTPLQLRELAACLEWERGRAPLDPVECASVMRRASSLLIGLASGSTVLAVELPPEPAPEPEEARQDVLCGCGWGLLGCPESELPVHCPVCGHVFVEEEAD